MENGSQKVTYLVRRGEPFGDLFATFSEHRFLDAFWSPFGSLLAPFGSLLDPFGSLLDPFGFILDPFGSILDPFGAMFDPFGSILLSFGALSQFWLPFWLHFRLLHSNFVFFFKKA